LKAGPPAPPDKGGGFQEKKKKFLGKGKVADESKTVREYVDLDPLEKKGAGRRGRPLELNGKNLTYVTEKKNKNQGGGSPLWR